ncbi:hypothetical protein B9N43_02485 [Denitratisoma sp. DHT3]|nr:hypothetical protein B9N43_02485 [Denitratisoma sp. DHT3]
MLFANLKRIREFERKNLPFMTSLEDREILLTIGYAQEQGHPVCFKNLTLSMDNLKRFGLGSAATIRRRVMRLIARGALEKYPADHDGRIVYLVLSEKSQRLFARYSGVMTSLYWR